jgi:hypothetical protein
MTEKGKWRGLRYEGNVTDRSQGVPSVTRLLHHNMFIDSVV